MTKEQQEIFDEFTTQMQAELLFNQSKGDWSEFKDQDKIICEIDYHANKLKKAIWENDDKAVKEHSADLSNISLFAFNSII